MRKIILLLFVFAALSFFGFRVVKQSVKNDLAQPVIIPSPTASSAANESVKIVRGSDVKRSIFVPYWALSSGKIEEKFDKYLYFGISPTSSGINKKETGFANMQKFLNSVPKNSEKKLVLRMLDSDITFLILKDATKQNSVIKDSISIAKENGFSGIVLDLEISAVPFESLIKQINEFTKLFYRETHEEDIDFAVMFYGDTFYRLRPFDIKALSGNADEFMIMSYDFSKSRGNPGPNFPLRGKEIYGYDMTRMAEDFLRYLSPEKTTIVFGLFGYDWKVDDRGNSIGQGEPLTYKQIKSKFLDKCVLKECVVRRKNDSTETEVRYTDGDGGKHIVWFEDMQSVTAKEKYLRERGIANFSFWAYSYF